MNDHSTPRRISLTGVDSVHESLLSCQVYVEPVGIFRIFSGSFGACHSANVLKCGRQVTDEASLSGIITVSRCQ